MVHLVLLQKNYPRILKLIMLLTQFRLMEKQGKMPLFLSITKQLFMKREYIVKYMFSLLFFLVHILMLFFFYFIQNVSLKVFTVL